MDAKWRFLVGSWISKPWVQARDINMGIIIREGKGQSMSKHASLKRLSLKVHTPIPRTSHLGLFICTDIEKCQLVVSPERRNSWVTI